MLGDVAGVRPIVGAKTGSDVLELLSQGGPEEGVKDTQGARGQG